MTYNVHIKKNQYSTYKAVQGNSLIDNDYTFIINLDKTKTNKILPNTKYYNDIRICDENSKLYDYRNLFILQIVEDIDSEFSKAIFTLGRPGHYNDINFVKNLVLYKKHYLFNKEKDNVYDLLVDFIHNAIKEVK